MKTFKIKDLMVSIATEKDLGAAYFCYPQTYTGCTIHHTVVACCKAYSAAPSCHGGCSILASVKLDCPANTAINCTGVSCGGGSRITDIIIRTEIEQELVLFQEAELAEIKTQLVKLQKQVDLKLQRSPEELDQLETKLTEAINEVRAEKANISKKK
jgi:hypothetical protein